MKSFDDYVLDFLSTYDNDCLHVAPALSQKRLHSAVAAHGVDPRDRVWAMLDSTLLGHTSRGSAENGMSITASGVFWKNSWMTKSRVTHYSWEDLVEVAASMEVVGGNLRFAPGVEFYSPANMKAAHLINLLQAMVRLYLDHRQAEQPSLHQPVATASAVEPAALMLEAGSG